MYGSFGSFGSYSSLSSTLSAPMSISSGNLRQHDATCAFPSWPRRSSLDSDDSERPTSFLSDDDLMGDPFEDDAHSISSAAGSAASSPHQQPTMVQQPTEEELFAMQRQRVAMERDLVRHIISEKERKRQARKAAAAAAALNHRRSSPKKGSPRSKLTNMTPIAEAGE